MLSIRDRRIRIAVVVVLLLAIGVAGYQITLSVWASWQYNAALQALDRCDFEAAGIHLDSCLWARPGDPEARVLAAQAARRRGEFDAAERHLLLAAKLAVPPDALAAERRFLAVQTGDMSDVVPLLKFCEESPDSPEAALALEAIIEGSLKSFQFPLAKHSIESWLRHRPRKFDQARGLVWQGRLRLFTLNMPGALADLRQAVELAPEYAPARVWLVEGLLRDDPRQALPHLDWLTQRQPKDLDVRLQTARARRTLAQPEDAGKILDEILIAHPDKVPALVERARVALDLDRADDAKRWLIRAYELAPNDREVLLAMSDCLRQMNLLDDAKRYQDKAREIDEQRQKRLDEMTGKDKR